jgi:MFS family permease
LRDTTLPPANTHSGILQRPYLWVTIGTCALVFLAAFESLAVTTIMPVVSRELQGADLYALAFAGPLATGVIGMVAAGNWSDRRGPAIPLYASVALFVAGLLIAGTAVSMPLLVAGRLVQGLGGGALTVALYVLVARIYPGLLHPRIFAAFSAAWVIPSLVGPFAAGIVAQVLSWHWVFLGVVGLVIPALVMIVPVLRGMTAALPGPLWRRLPCWGSTCRGRSGFPVLPPSRHSWRWPPSWLPWWPCGRWCRRARSLPGAACQV